jgi:DNA adenine methylase
MRHASPLRYPGGKTVLAQFLTDVIDMNDLRGCTYFEPFAGGAGAALSLLSASTVSALTLNDADPRIYAFWHACLHMTQRFVDRIMTIPVDMKEWQRQRDICQKADRRSMFDLGFSAFFMNRCNRSGVLTGAGPIGGHDQTGNYGIDVRFTREELATRVMRLGAMRESITIYNLDAIDFLKQHVPRGRGRNRVFVYLDPPYVNKGQRLYLNSYQDDDHASLAQYLRQQNHLPWIMSYDDSELVRRLYADLGPMPMPIRYSLQDKRTSHELIIAPDNIDLPGFCRIGKHAHPLTRIA